MAMSNREAYKGKEDWKSKENGSKEGRRKREELSRSRRGYKHNHGRDYFGESPINKSTKRWKKRRKLGSTEWKSRKRRNRNQAGKREHSGRTIVQHDLGGGSRRGGRDGLCPAPYPLRFEGTNEVHPREAVIEHNHFHRYNGLIFYTNINQLNSWHVFFSAYKWRSSVWNVITRANILSKNKNFLSFVCVCPLSYPIAKNFVLSQVMDKGKKSYKEAICTTKASNGQETQQTQNCPAKPVITEVHQTVISDETCSNPKLENSTIKKEKGKAKLKIDVLTYMSQLSDVRENCEKKKSSSLMGFVFGKPIEFSKLKLKLRNDSDWKNIKGEVEFIERQNYWFEINFSNPVDKEKIWERRPYHIFGQLLLLKPWRAGFEPLKEPTTQLDMWIRIPLLPAEFVNFDAIKTILEVNKVGELIKLDPRIVKRESFKFTRVCVNIDLALGINSSVLIPNENGELKSFTVWYEEFPQGCGNCSYTFNQCPLRNPYPQTFQLTVTKPSQNRGQQQNTNLSGDRSMEEGWLTTSYTKKKPIENPKETSQGHKPYLTEYGGVNLVYKSDDSSNESKISSKTPSINNQREEPQEKIEEEQETPPNRAVEKKELNHVEMENADHQHQNNCSNEGFLKDLTNFEHFNEEEDDLLFDELNEGEFTQEEMEALLLSEGQEADGTEVVYSEAYSEKSFSFTPHQQLYHQDASNHGC